MYINDYGMFSYKVGNCYVVQILTTVGQIKQKIIVVSKTKLLFIENSKSWGGIHDLGYLNHLKIPTL
jgi:hypothetical protein